MGGKPKAPDNSKQIAQQEEQLRLMRDQMTLQEEANKVTQANIEKQRLAAEAEAKLLKDQNAASVTAKKMRGMGRSLLAFDSEAGVDGLQGGGFSQLLQKTLGA